MPTPLVPWRRRWGDGLVPGLHRTLLASEETIAEARVAREAVAAQVGLFSASAGTPVSAALCTSRTANAGRSCAQQ